MTLAAFQGPCPVCHHDSSTAPSMADLLNQIKALTAERDHWKANHETEVRRARILKERTDMPIERIDAYEKWGEDQKKLAEALDRNERLHYRMQHCYSIDGMKALLELDECKEKLALAQAEIERIHINQSAELWKATSELLQEQLKSVRADAVNSLVGLKELFEEIEMADKALSEGDGNEALIGVRRIHSAMGLVKSHVRNHKLV